MGGTPSTINVDYNITTTTHYNACHNYAIEKSNANDINVYTKELERCIKFVKNEINNSELLN